MNDPWCDFHGFAHPAFPDESAHRWLCHRIVGDRDVLQGDMIPNTDGQWFRALDGAWKGEGKPLVCTGPNCPACVLTGEKWSLRRRIAFRTAFLWRAFRSDGFVYGYGGALISNAWGWQRAVLIVFAVMVYGEILEHRKIVRKQRRGA